MFYQVFDSFLAYANGWVHGWHVQMYPRAQACAIIDLNLGPLGTAGLQLQARLANLDLLAAKDKCYYRVRSPTKGASGWVPMRLIRGNASCMLYIRILLAIMLDRP